MRDLASTAKKLAATLNVSFEKAKVGGHSCLEAVVSDHYAMTERVRPLAVESERSGHLLFVGLFGDEGPHRLFLLPARSSLDVVSLFNVGTHNASGDAGKAVHAALARIHAEHPFSVYFADAAGYKAAFADAPDKKAAKRIERIVLDVNPEAMDLSEDPVWKTIHEEGILQLWWD